MFNASADDFDSVDAYNDYLEKVEIMIYDIYNENNAEEVWKMIENEWKTNQEGIIKNAVTHEETMSALRSNALIDDAIYNEHLRTEAEMHRNTDGKEDLEVLAHEMPFCMNIDSTYNIDELGEELRGLFLRASGCDVNEYLLTAKQDGLV